MNRKWLILIGLIAVTIGVIYYLFFTKPVPFLNEQQIIDEMNALNNRIKVQKIEDIIKLDDEHYFIPFIRENGQTGAGYYRWSRAKWRVIYFGYNNFAKVWQLDKNDPETKYIVWHYPEGSVDYMELYLMKDRYFSSSEEVSYYEPKTQLVEKIGVGKHYGAFKISNDFSSVIRALETPRSNPTNFFGMFNVHELYYLGLNFFKGEEETYPEGSASNSYSIDNAKASIDHLPYVGRSQLE